MAMTKKQLIQVLEILNDDDEVLALHKGKYTSESEASVTGIKIMFKRGLPQAVILVEDNDDDELLKAA